MTRRFAWSLVAVGGLALAVRALAVLVIDPQVPEVGDASAYHLLGNNLADGRGFIRPFDLDRFGVEVPTAEYPPLHSLVVGLFSLLGAKSVEAQRLALSLVGTATVVLVALLGRRVAGEATGIVAGILAALYPMLWLPEATLMSETVFAFLVTSALLLTYEAHERPQLWRFAALGAVTGLATLTRAEGGLLALLLVVPLAMRLRDTARGRQVLLGGVALTTAALVVVPWTVRNLVTFDRFVPVSNNLGTALAGANCRLTYSGDGLGSWRSTFGEQVAGEDCFRGFNGREPGFNEAEAAGAARAQGIEYALDHVDDWPQVVAARWLRTFALYRVEQQITLESLEGRPRDWERAGTWMFWLLVPFAIVGTVVLWRRRAWVWPLLAPFVAVTVSVIVTYGNQRFRIGAEPGLVVLAATGIVAIARRGLVGSPR